MTSFQYRQPCLGFFLMGGVKALAVMDMGVELAMVVILTFGITAVYPEWKGHCSGVLDTKTRHWVDPDPARCFLRPFHWAYYYFYNVLSLLLSTRLFMAASQREKRALKSWLLKSSIAFIPWIALYISHIAWLHMAAMGLAAFGGFGIYKIYSYWVVFCLIKEIEYYSEINGPLSIMSDRDIEEWVVGNPAIPPRSESERFSDNEMDFEIPPSRLKLDERRPLGRGAFGIVYKAKLYKKPGDPFMVEQYQTVAVKTPNQVDGCYVKALLTELQVLNSIGRHEHIVNLIGACTTELSKGTLFVVVEFCPFGSVEEYLRSRRGIMVDDLNMDDVDKSTSSIKGFSSSYIPWPGHHTLSSICLIKWAMQTASGMEYLAGRNVFHGDLAARNVLITANINVKIADFGLSRQLYHHSTYVGREGRRLAWKWMALESLTERKFSTKSDVWSYGITLWEYFTCGLTPYPFQDYSEEILGLLKRGELRPEKPCYATQEIYDKMLQCWDADPKKRPSFTELKYFFDLLYNHYSDSHESKSIPHKHGVNDMNEDLTENVENFVAQMDYM